MWQRQKSWEIKNTKIRQKCKFRIFMVFDNLFQTYINNPVSLQNLIRLSNKDIIHTYNFYLFYIYQIQKKMYVFLLFIQILLKSVQWFMNHVLKIIKSPDAQYRTIRLFEILWNWIEQCWVHLSSWNKNSVYQNTISFSGSRASICTFFTSNTNF